MNEEKIKILGFVGPSGCGKDTAAHFLQTSKPDRYNYVKLNTTRPQRDIGDDGYVFMSNQNFLNEILNGDMLNAQEFRGWYYGLSKNALDKEKINLLPMNNEMVMQMTEENRDDYELVIIYINTFQKSRLLHILERELNPDCREVCRRFLSDIDDYENNKELIKHCSYVVDNRYNSNFYLDMVLTAEKCFEGD